jgi:hypothetical protein
VLAERSSGYTNKALVAFESGAQLFSGNAAANRRVFFPSLNSTYANWMVDFKTLLQRSLRWAASGVAATPTPTSTPTSTPTATPTATPIQIGLTSIAPLGDNGNANLLIAQQATLGQNATIQSLSFYITTAAGNLRLGIYDNTGPGGGPGALKAFTAEFTPITGWNTRPVTTPVLLTAGTYWLAYLPQSSTLAFQIDRSGAGSAVWYSYAYGPLPATFATSGLSGDTVQWSFYGTLNP